MNSIALEVWPGGPDALLRAAFPTVGAQRINRAGRQAAQKSEQTVFKKIKALRAAAAYDEDYGDKQATTDAGR